MDFEMRKATETADFKTSRLKCSIQSEIYKFLFPRSPVMNDCLYLEIEREGGGIDFSLHPHGLLYWILTNMHAVNYSIHMRKSHMEVIHTR